MRQFRPRRPAGYGIGILAATLVAALTASAAEPAQARPNPTRPDITADWLTHTITVAAQTGNEVSQRRTWAIAWWSAQRALQTRTNPPVTPAQRPRFEDAAVATAVHDVLAALVPDRAEDLDDALHASLAAIPDSPGERAGISAGAAAATRTLHERDSDGLDPATVNRPFPDPPPAPGVYRLPADATTPSQLAGLGEARPFLLNRADQYHPGPPAPLGSKTYLRDLDEVRQYGSRDSTIRNQQQTETALLWAQPALQAYAPALSALVQDSGRSLTWKVRLLAAFTIATLDAGIAVAEAKYTYLWWRPITAIQEGDIDPDPDWAPLRPTPAHPEYPSGHASFAGAAEQVLAHFTGPRSPVAFTISNPREAVTRELPRGTRWSSITQDVVDARVWIGVHFRTTDEISAHLGRQIAEHTLTHLR